MREIRTLRATRRGLEMEPRASLNGHEGGNPGHSQGKPYGPPRQPSTLPGLPGIEASEKNFQGIGAGL